MIFPVRCLAPIRNPDIESYIKPRLYSLRFQINFLHILHKLNLHSIRSKKQKGNIIFEDSILNNNIFFYLLVVSSMFMDFGIGPPGFKSLISHLLCQLYWQSIQILSAHFLIHNTQILVSKPVRNPLVVRLRKPNST